MEAQSKSILHRLASLRGVTAKLETAATFDDVAALALAGCAALDCRQPGTAALWLVDPAARVVRRIAAAAERQDEAELALDGDHAIGRALRTRAPVVDASAIAIPLCSRGDAIGVLAVSDPHASEPATQALLGVLADQLGPAIQRVRDAAVITRRTDDALRTREEILSVVSHDLRNPLGTILMGASTLLQFADPDDPKLSRIRTIGERIHRQSERMARLIDDLVDFSTIDAGKLALQRTPSAPRVIVELAAERIATVVQERGIAIDVRIDDGLPAIDCDPERVAQALASLAAIATKVTPKAGRIELAARRVGDDVVLSVHDSGPGIPADELPELFDGYWRSKTGVYKGAGLALAIAHGIVVAHGGRIWAESGSGAGCTFHVALGTGATA